MKFKNISSSHRLKFIPFFFTFSNALLGALAVMQAINDQFIIAVYCILLAAFMDTLDGRVARAFNSTSGIGAELDSLCDAISFCFAPILLLYSWGISDFGIIGYAVLGLYLCAGLFRLARFNTFPSDKDYFLGLPTPMAAFFLLSFILHKEWLESHSYSFLFGKNLFSLIIVLISFLMVSNISFPSFKSKNTSTTKWFIASIFLILVIMSLKKYPILFIAPLFYILSGLFFQSYRALKSRYLKLLSKN